MILLDGLQDHTSFIDCCLPGTRRAAFQMQVSTLASSMLMDQMSHMNQDAYRDIQLYRSRHQSEYHPPRRGSEPDFDG